MTNTIVVPPPSPPNTGVVVNCQTIPGPGLPFPIDKTTLYGGYPPLNPTSAWSGYAPPPTGCVYGLSAADRSWVPVVTMWEVMCIVQEATANTVPEAPRDGSDYVRNGLAAEWINVQDLTFDGGQYP